MTLPKMAHHGKVPGENPGKPRVFEASNPRFLIVFGKVASGEWLEQLPVASGE
jgi:hypothetical protein